MRTDGVSLGGAQLSRGIGVVTATGIVIANMIGSGIFTSSGLMAAQLPGAGWVLLCWVLGGFIATAGALSYGELATRMPEAGGEYVYIKRLYHPAFGFLTGWTSFIVGFSAPIALSALGLAEYIFAGFADRVGGTANLAFLKQSVAAATVALFTLVHYLGAKLGGRVQNVLTALKIVIVVCLAVTGLALAGGGSGNPLDFGGGGTEAWSFGAAMMMVMFSYSGWNAAAYIASEVRKPKLLPATLVVGTLAVAAIYLLVNLFYFSAAPYEALAGQVAVAERAASSVFGNWMPELLSGLFGVAMLSSLSAYILIGPRVYYAMAKDRLFFPFAAKVHPKHKVPGRAILVQGALAVAMIFIGSFEQLLIYVGFALGIFPFMAVAGLFIARARRVGESDAVRTPAFPLVPLFYLVASAVLMAIAYMERPWESTFAVVTVALGVPVYFLWVKGMAKSEPRMDTD